jgi:WD40 repeat protein
VEAPFWHPGGVFGSALSPDGKRLATAAGRSVILWDTATGGSIRRFDTPGPSTRMSLAYSPDGRRLAAGGGYSGDLFVWDVGTGKEVHRVAGRRDWETVFLGVVGFTPDGRQLVLDRLGTTEFVDTRAWEEVRTSVGSGRLYSPVGPTLVGQARGGVTLTGLGRGGSTVRLPMDPYPGGLALSPDGRTLAAFTLSHRLELWSVPDGRQLRAADLAGNLATGVVAFSPAGDRVFLDTPEGLSWWDVATLAVAHPLPRPASNVTALHPLPDGDTLLVCLANGFTQRFSLKSGKAPDKPAGYTNGYVPVAAAPDGRRLAVGRPSGEVELWDTTTGKRVGTAGRSDLAGVEGRLYTPKLRFSPDGKALAIDRGRGVEVCDSAGRPLAEISLNEILKARTEGDRDEFRNGSGPSPTAHLIAFGPADRLLMVRRRWQRGPELLVWDRPTRTAGLVRPFAHDLLAAFHPDGTAVVVTSKELGLTFLDPKTGAELRRANWPHDERDGVVDPITALAFSPDGRRLVAATDDGRFHLCDPATGRPLATFPPADLPARPHAPRTVRTFAGARAISFSPDGAWLLADAKDGSIHIWEVATRKEAHRLVGHEPYVTLAAFGPDARSVLSTGRDAAVYQWDARPAGPSAESPWDALAADDPAIAYRATWALTDDPAGAVRTLRANLPPAAGPTPEELARLIDRLNADQFAAREAATRALADLGPLAVPALKAAHSGKLSAEAGERVTKLLGRKADELIPAGLRAVRAVQVLERIGTPEAKALLGEWAAGADGAVLTEEARWAVRRLKGQR